MYHRKGSVKKAASRHHVVRTVRKAICFYITRVCAAAPWDDDAAGLGVCDTFVWPFYYYLERAHVRALF